nr:retrotransposon Orf1 [Tanacetum cinerariifolium]
LRDRNAKESWALLTDRALYDNESWNDPREFAKTLSQDVSSTSDHRLIKLENQVQRLMKAHLALTQPPQVNKVTTSCEICSGPHDTHYCVKDSKEAFFEYASSCTDEVRGLVSNFVASQDARLSKFKADFKQQQSKMTNKIDIVLKAITDQITGILPSETVRNPKLSTSLVSSARSYPNMDPQCSNLVYVLITNVTIYSEQQSDSYDDKANENEEEEKDSPKNIHVDPSTSPDPSVAFITKKVLKFNSFFKSLRLEKRNLKGSSNRRVSNFIGRIKETHVCIGNFTYVIDFMIFEDISSVIDPRLSQVVLGRPFVEISNVTHDPPEGVVRFTNENDEIAYKMPYKIEQYNSLSNLEKEHTKSVYLRNEEDKRRGVEYIMGKILRFYKECPRASTRVIFDEKKLRSS